MNKVIIENFGPIKKIELEISDVFNIVIGAQASGKSTLVKTIYFCRKIKDYLIEFLSNSQMVDNHSNEDYVSFIKYIRSKYMGCFGTTKHLQTFKITYFYDVFTSSYVKITLDEKNYARFSFSLNIKNSILNTMRSTRAVYEKMKWEADNYSLFDRYNNEIVTSTLLNRELKKEISNIFFDPYDIIYIPAGRSILSTFSDQLTELDVSQMDLPMQEFVRLILNNRRIFNCKIDEFVNNYLKTVKGQINNADVALAIKLMSAILKGEYVCDKDGEKIFYDADHWVKLMYSSSGQQESLWILMLIFSYLLENRKAFIILEEPEAHLFPEGQLNMVKFISLFCNSTKSSVFITTHSPYVLTSFNVLMHSYKVENNLKCGVEDKK